MSDRPSEPDAEQVIADRSAWYDDLSLRLPALEAASRVHAGMMTSIPPGYHATGNADQTLELAEVYMRWLLDGTRPF